MHERTGRCITHMDWVAFTNRGRKGGREGERKGEREGVTKGEVESGKA